MSDDMNQRMEQVKQRLQRLATGNENNPNLANHMQRAPSQVPSRTNAPMRQSFQSNAPSTFTRQPSAQQAMPPQQQQYMQPVYPPQQASLTKSRSARLQVAPNQPQDYGRMSMPTQYSRQPGPYGQPPSRIQTQAPPANRPAPQQNEIPSTHELAMRLKQQRAQYEGTAAPSREHVANPPQTRPERVREVPQQVRQEPRREPRHEKIPSSYASSSTSSAFSEYSDHPSKASYQPSLNGEDRNSAPSVVTDLSEEVDDEFDHKLMPPIRKNEYDFQWEGGALGLVLVEDAQLRVPIVKRVSTHVSTAAKYVKEGDLLIYINANNTRDYKMPQLMGMLKDLKKPICMRFRRVGGADLPDDDSAPMLPPLEPSEYEFLWEEGSLGMTLGVTAAAIPYVKRLTGRGNSPHLALVVPGDELIMINEKVCGEMGFDAAMEFIKSVPKPAVLRFRQVNTNNDATASQAEAQTAKDQSSLLKLDEASMYAVQWSDGPFGLTVKELITDAGPVPVVTRKTGRNTCAGLRRVAVGDILVEIGTMRVMDLGFENATKVLRNIAKPVTLKFQAVGD